MMIRPGAMLALEPTVSCGTFRIATRPRRFHARIQGATPDTRGTLDTDVSCKDTAYGCVNY